MIYWFFATILLSVTSKDYDYNVNVHRFVMTLDSNSTLLLDHFRL